MNPLGILPQLSFGSVPNPAGLSYDGRFPLEAVYADYSVVDGITKVWDIAMKREFHYKEKVRLILRMDTYNAFNHTQFSSVNASAQFDANGNQVNTALGQINGARASRRAEGSIRVTF